MADTPTTNGTTDTAAPLTPVEGANLATDQVSDAASGGLADAKTRFGKAIEEAKAGASALKDEAVGRTAAYKDKASTAASDWTEQANAYAAQAKDKSLELANQGKTKASDALSSLGKTISSTAPTIDEKLGVQYGDYARSAARSIQETAAKLESKELSELGEDVKDVVRKSPAIAVGIAAVAGFFLARALGGSDKSDA
ncbi:hypothetical protein OLX02_03120 [Novosphingobium sp. KCTC 2891]|uniref:hypothetical protein n=1 Tax=Novosphingobium sp. KCTC 2891 TaxID=2989730 RepID=UPI002223D99B|nr:hypothetical protein [Novosphingobium sp. KCTC 2891]MCW1381808.1 hypothetical protein [Novosphingobium sp. KCTC 2891]